MCGVIGYNHTTTLEYHSIKTAYDFTKKKRSWVRCKMSVIGEQTWMELQGIKHKIRQTERSSL